MSPDRITGFAASYDPRDPYTLDPNDDDRPFDSVVDLSVRWMDKVRGAGKPFFHELLHEVCAQPLQHSRPQAPGALLQKDGRPVSDRSRTDCHHGAWL